MKLITLESWYQQQLEKLTRKSPKDLHKHAMLYSFYTNEKTKYTENFARDYTEWNSLYRAFLESTSA